MWGFHLRLPLCLAVSVISLYVQCSSAAGTVDVPTEIKTCNLKNCTVDVPWAEWSNWSSCSKSCDNGIQTRTRNCTKQDSDGTSQCSGNSTETKTCNLKNCTVDVPWAEWSNWSSCSKTCDNGIQTRTRNCTKQDSDGTSQCSGNSTETKTCNLKNCTVDVLWAAWSNWSSCSKSCDNGIQTRTRNCAKQDSDGTSQCSGNSTETKTCNLKNCTASSTTMTTTTMQAPTTNTTSPTTTTTKVVATGTPKTTTNPIPDVNLSFQNKKEMEVNFVLAISATYKPELKDKSSQLYKNYSSTMQKSLEDKFVNDTGLSRSAVTININGFSKGSLIVNYTTKIRKEIRNETELIKLYNNVEKAATTNWNTVPLGKVLHNETKQINAQNTRSLLQPFCVCPFGEYTCAVLNDKVTCAQKCDGITKCGEHGHCVIDKENPVCLCDSNENVVYHGQFCEENTPKKSIKPSTSTSDAISLSKMTIIAIAGGVGGGLLLILLISIACFCYRLQNGKRHGSFSDTSSKCDSDIVRTNNKMENIPLDSNKMNAFYKPDREETKMRYHSEPQRQSSRTNPLYQEDREEAHMRYYPEPRRDHDRVSRGSMNFQTFPDRPRTESLEGYGQPMKTSYYNEPGDLHRRNFQNSQQNGPESDYRRQNQRNNIDDQRRRSGETNLNDDRYVYIEAKSGDRRLYKKVEDEDLGGNTLIYQPSNIPRPIQRENVESVGDNFSMRPAPAYTESQRPTTYDTIDMEKPYKIQRPNIKHNNLYS